jgi:hypothetical protein
MKDRFRLNRLRKKLVVGASTQDIWHDVDRQTRSMSNNRQLTGWCRNLWYTLWCELFSLRTLLPTNTWDRLMRRHDSTRILFKHRRLTVQFTWTIRRIPAAVRKDFETLQWLQTNRSDVDIGRSACRYFDFRAHCKQWCKKNVLLIR